MPNSRTEFEHNMHLLSEKIEKGQIRISESTIRTIKGIMNVRYAPNNRVNLHTVNEMARLMANSIANMMQHEEFKSEEYEGE